MLMNYRNESINYIKNTCYGDMLKSALWNQIEAPLSYNMTINTKKTKILNIADRLLPLGNITKNDLENYAKVASLPKLFKLIIERKVNIAEMNLIFPQYEVEYHQPLMKGSRHNSIEDILLTHTYSYSMNLTEVRSIYSNLLNNSKMASDVMHYAAINIINGDDLKIFFGPKFEGFEGGYIPFLNYVIVNPSYAKFTNENVAIHELSHYALCNLNPNTRCAPFDISKLSFLNSAQDDLYGYRLNSNMGEVKFFQELKDDASIFLQYEQAAKLVFIKAGKLLGLSEEEFAPYSFSKDFILYFKDNSLIDLFFNSPSLTFSQKKVNSQAYYQYINEFYPEQSINKQLNFEDLKSYYELCPVKVNFEYISLLRFEENDNVRNQIDFVKDYYFSYFKDQKNLTDNQVWFLERMADLVNREKDIYDIKSSYYNEHAPNYYQYYVELIVRYPELKASNMDQDILDSFSGLIQFWECNVSPLIQGQIDDFYAQQKPLDFSYHL